jgi:hypothetical protein
MPRASANRAPDDPRSDERTRLSRAKNEDDVGLLRAMREQQASVIQLARSCERRHCASSKLTKTCGEVTIGHPNIRAVPVRPFRRDQE